MLYADRADDWEVHLNVVQKYLPLFASAVHYNYLNSAYHYIQTMLIFKKFIQYSIVNFRQDFMLSDVEISSGVALDVT